MERFVRSLKIEGKVCRVRVLLLARVRSPAQAALSVSRAAKWR
jgi:hypothetical protein